MIELWYINVSGIEDNRFKELLSDFPDSVVSEIEKFRFINDQKLSFFGKWLVLKFHSEKGIPFNWKSWKKSESGKPHLQGGFQFNISHSGHFVVAAFSNESVGVDIEEIRTDGLIDISTFFHLEEQNYIQANKDMGIYYVWTRKEAFLKASGIGVVQGLNQDNCLFDEVRDQNNITWHISTIKNLKNYLISLCTPIVNSQVVISEKTA